MRPAPTRSATDRPNHARGAYYRALRVGGMEPTVTVSTHTARLHDGDDTELRGFVTVPGGGIDE